jgi:hypothetical protein
VYMLNMLFDVGRPVPDGLFSEPPPSTTNPLLNSKRWLKGSGANQPDQAIVNNPHDPANWSDLERFNVLIPKANGAANGHRIRIRIAPVAGTLPSPPPGSTYVIDYVVAFGRPPVGGGQFASPFREPNPSAALVKTTFMDTNVAPDVDTSGNVIGWIIDLGRIADNAHPTGSGGAARPDLANRYEFALGVVLKTKVTGTSTTAIVRFYGEDPEEDVGG